MAKITYLLGAGASANTIPIVANMPTRISEINNFLKNCRPQYIFTDKPLILSEDKEGILDEIIKDFDWLLNQSKYSNSIDTLAKKYYLMGDNENYEKLKKCLIIYLTIEQFYFIESKKDGKYAFEKNLLDKRYDSFVAAIASRLNGKIELNNNIKVLSWNYDLQMELSLMRFTDKSISEIKRKYQIFPLLNQRPQNHGKHILIPEKFTLRKLNGNAIFSTSTARLADEDDTIFDTKKDNVSDVETFSMLLDEIRRLEFRNNIACRYFNFSWEILDDFDNDFGGRKHEQYLENLTEAEKIASETEILVVIGYSFPIFNREIDNKLFNKMQQLTKVYIQDKYPERIKSTMFNAFKILQEKVGGDAGIPSSPRVIFQEETNTDQFVIPYELNQE